MTEDNFQEVELEYQQIPIDSPCPSCEKELFGEKDRDGDSVWLFRLPDRIDGIIAVSRNDDGDVRFRIKFDCPNAECDQTFRVRELASDTMIARKNP